MPPNDLTTWIPRVDVLGVGVSAINMDTALEVIDRWITGGARQYICVTGVHGVMESQRDETLREIHNAAGSSRRMVCRSCGSVV